MSYEDEVGKQLEKQAAAQALSDTSSEEIDAAFGFRQAKKAHKKSGGASMTRMRSRSGKSAKRKGAEPEKFMHKGKGYVGKPSDG